MPRRNIFPAGVCARQGRRQFNVERFGRFEARAAINWEMQRMGAPLVFRELAIAKDVVMARS